MANIWVIESSQVVRRMVDIALDGLPASLSFGDHITDLIKQTKVSPHLVLCAEQLSASSVSSGQTSYLSQLPNLAKVGYKCPVIILQNQSTTEIDPQPLDGGLLLVKSIRKPFKTFELLKAVCEAMAWTIPHEDVFSERTRQIPLARPQKDVPLAKPEVLLPPSMSTPEPTSVGSLMGQYDELQPSASPPPLTQEEAVVQAPPPPLMQEEALVQAPPPPLMQEEAVVQAPPSPLVSTSVMSPEDLSPQSEEIALTADTALLPSQQRPEASQPSADESFQFDFSSETSDPKDDHSSSREDPVVSTQKSTLPQELEDDWLEESGATVNTQAIGSEPPAELKVYDQETSNIPEEIADEVPPSTIESNIDQEWVDQLKQAVNEVSEHTLQVVQRTVSARSNHQELSSEDMRVMIERIAWEVIPALAAEQIRDRLTQMMSQQR